MHIHPEALDGVERRVKAIIERDGQITLAQLRDELQTSRKYAQALLEHFDAAHVTLRRGDVRVLRRRRAAAP
jgi:selenocysteine-specific elongation factor